MYTADLALIASRLSQALLQESFTSIWWLSFKVETWKFTKNKLLNLVSSRKTKFPFAGLNVKRIIQKKKCQKKARFMDDASKTKSMIYLNVETWLLLAHPHQNFWLRA